MRQTSLTAFLVFLGVTSLVWGSCLALSTHLSTAHLGQSAVPAKSSPELEAAERRVAEAPQDISVMIQLAEIYENEALRVNDPKLVMKAVDTYRNVLLIDSENAQALLSLAHIAGQFGVFDRAAEYYQQYLVKNPKDLNARNDYALALLQSGKIAEAKTILAELLSSDPTLIPARLGLALALNREGKQKEALKTGQQALRYAKDDAERKQIESVLELLKTEGSAAIPTSPGTPSAPQSTFTSPATLVQDYFSGHPILGPKLASITWNGPTEARVALNNFPIEAMPSFAREKLLHSMTDAFSALPDPVTIVLTDAQTERELLRVPVGIVPSKRRP